jgi:hypothetical protein
VRRSCVGLPAFRHLGGPGPQQHKGGYFVAEADNRRTEVVVAAIALAVKLIPPRSVPPWLVVPYVGARGSASCEPIAPWFGAHGFVVPGFGACGPIAHGFGACGFVACGPIARGFGSCGFGAPAVGTTRPVAARILTT